MNVEVTPLPGIGVRKDFPLTGVRRRIGVVDHKDGTIDLIFTKIGDPDATTQIPMSEAEAGTLANLLGAPQLVGQLRDEYRDMDGVNTRQLPVSENSPYDGRTLGDTRMRTRTKTSIVAVMRAGQAMPAPGPDFVFTGGDVLIVVGTSDGLDEAADILKDG